MDRWGVADGYRRSNGAWHRVPHETVAAIHQAMGRRGRAEPPVDGPLVVVAGHTPRIAGPAVVVTEDGGELAVGDRLPPDLPPGYHRLRTLDDGRSTTLIVSPGRCAVPAGRAWGWALQLYAARSRSSWGIGDLGDLRRLGRWATAELGAGFLLLNPLHAALPGLPQQASPYFPSSRRFRNPLYLRVEEVPGARSAGATIDAAATAGRALNGRRLIDRDAAYRLKLEALDHLWAAFAGDPAFDRYCREQGPSLAAYATFCTLVEDLGRPWATWPEEYRRPDSPAVGAYREAHFSRVRFHEWIQWLIDGQLAEAGRDAPLIHDLAVGADPGGADAWLWQGALAPDITVGAPPDEFNTRGQNWGLPPFDPWKLRAAGYAPFIETVRATLRHAAGVRLDHVMGLSRLFWVPAGCQPGDGTYVRYPLDDLLAIVALESQRAGAFVVGEDLGTVEDDLRASLSAHGVLSYRLLWFEEDPPEQWPERAMAAVTTHDLPTVAGLWSGHDFALQQELGLEPNEEATAGAVKALRAAAHVQPDDAVEDVVEAAHRALARSPSLLLAATLEDALGVEERPNMPGTLDEWPNWSIALPEPLEVIETRPGPRRVAGALHRPPPAAVPQPDR